MDPRYLNELLYIDENAEENGCIKVGSAFAETLGFTSNKFDGYLWKDDNTIIISYIHSLHPKQGNLIKLFSSIERLGYKIIVPTPLGEMVEFLKKRGFKKKVEYDEYYEDFLETWSKE